MDQPDRNLANIDAPSAFRDRIASMDDDGKRKWVFPRKPFGRFYDARTWFSYLLLAIVFSGPFITINGRPFLLLNIGPLELHGVLLLWKRICLEHTLLTDCTFTIL